MFSAQQAVKTHIYSELFLVKPFLQTPQLFSICLSHISPSPFYFVEHGFARAMQSAHKISH